MRPKPSTLPARVFLKESSKVHSGVFFGSLVNSRWLKMARALPLVMSLPLISGCIEGFDSATGTDAAYYRLTDYRIDRPRVLGVSYWPLVVKSGMPVTFEALAATPERLENVSVEWWGCGITRAEPFSYYGADCLGTSIAEYLGQGKTLTVTMPQYDTSSCEDYGCYGFFPVMAVVKEPSITTKVGYGVTYVAPDYEGEVPPVYFDLHYSDLTFTVGEEGEDGSNEGQTSVVARPGERVPLRAKLLTQDVDFVFNWYVSAGDLELMGVTRANEVDLNSGGRRNEVASENALIIPEDFQGDEIAVYLVIDTVSYYYPGLERFAVGKIRVER